MEKLNELLELNVNNMTEKKGKFTYLSWALQNTIAMVRS